MEIIKKLELRIYEVDYNKLPESSYIFYEEGNCIFTPYILGGEGEKYSKSNELELFVFNGTMRKLYKCKY